MIIQINYRYAVFITSFILSTGISSANVNKEIDNLKELIEADKQTKTIKNLNDRLRLNLFREKTVQNTITLGYNWENFSPPEGEDVNSSSPEFEVQYYFRGISMFNNITKLSSLTKDEKAHAWVGIKYGGDVGQETAEVGNAFDAVSSISVYGGLYQPVFRSNDTWYGEATANNYFLTVGPLIEGTVSYFDDDQLRNHSHKISMGLRFASFEAPTKQEMQSDPDRKLDIIPVYYLDTIYTFYDGIDREDGFQVRANYRFFDTKLSAFIQADIGGDSNGEILYGLRVKVDPKTIKSLFSLK